MSKSRLCCFSCCFWSSSKEVKKYLIDPKKSPVIDDNKLLDDDAETNLFLMNVICESLVNEAEINLTTWMQIVQLNSFAISFSVHSHYKEDMHGFFSYQRPGITLKNYLLRLQKVCNITTTDLLCILIYVDKFITKTQIKLYPTNLHRIVLVAGLVTCKFHDDIRSNNLIFSKHGGVSNAELNNLEKTFLNSLGYELYISDEIFENYKKNFLQNRKSALTTTVEERTKLFVPERHYQAPS